MRRLAYLTRAGLDGRVLEDEYVVGKARDDARNLRYFVRAICSSTPLPSSSVVAAVDCVSVSDRYELVELL